MSQSVLKCLVLRQVCHAERRRDRDRDREEGWSQSVLEWHIPPQVLSCRETDKKQRQTETGDSVE